MQILAPVTYRFEDVPAEEIDSAITAAPVPAEDVEAVEKLVDAETKSEEEVAVVAAMQSARKAFDEAAETARAASDKARAAIDELNAVQEDDDEEAVEARARADETSAAAVAAVQAAKLAKAEVATTTSAVAQFAQEEAEMAMEKAAAAAVEAAREDTDDITAADLKAKEEALSAAARAKRMEAAAKRDELVNLAAFEFPEFDLELPEVDRKVAGTAVVGALGVAGLAAEADLASSLVQVGGEAAMTTAFAFLFANNMVFKKDRDRLLKGLESRQQFEEFLLSGQWMGKDSFAREVAKDTRRCSIPRNRGRATRARRKRRAPRRTTTRRRRRRRTRRRRWTTEKRRTKTTKLTFPTSSAAADEAEEKDAEKKKTKTISWSGIFGSRRRRKPPTSRSPSPRVPPTPRVPKPQPPEPSRPRRRRNRTDPSSIRRSWRSDRIRRRRAPRRSRSPPRSPPRRPPPARPSVPMKPPSGKARGTRRSGRPECPPSGMRAWRRTILPRRGSPQGVGGGAVRGRAVLDVSVKIQGGSVHADVAGTRRADEAARTSPETTATDGGLNDRDKDRR